MSNTPLRALLGRVRRMLRNRFYIVFGMRGTAPVNPGFGADRGTPVDRYYIARFLEAKRAIITGRVLEIGDRGYTERFGVGVTQSDVLNAVEAPGVTYVGDLTSCPEIPDGTYDCIVLTQVLQCIYDMAAVLREAHRILKPGGTVLCTTPGITQVSRYDMERWGDRWRLTSQSAEELFGSVFDPVLVEIATYGNAFSSVCFLQGIPAERLNSRKLDRREPDHQIIVAIAAGKAATNG